MRWLALMPIAGCTMTTFEVRSVADVQVLDTTRPLLAPFVVEGTAVEAHACTPDPVDVFALIQQAQGSYPALVSVVIERQVIEHWAQVVKRKSRAEVGKPQKAAADQVCYVVQGFPVRLDDHFPGAAPE